jgi:hypothetical protein
LLVSFFLSIYFFVVSASLFSVSVLMSCMHVLTTPKTCVLAHVRLYPHLCPSHPMSHLYASLDHQQTRVPAHARLGLLAASGEIRQHRD